MTINYDNSSIEHNGQIANLTQLEYLLLRYLDHNQDRFVPAEELTEKIFYRTKSDNNLRATICRLRRHFREIGLNHLEVLLTQSGFKDKRVSSYKLNSAQSSHGI